MKARQWYRARIRWAEMVEGRGILNWEEGLYLFHSEDREAAFVRALEVGEGGQHHLLVRRPSRAGHDRERGGGRRSRYRRYAERARDCAVPLERVGDGLEAGK